MKQNHYDVIIIGGGPGGYVAAIRTSQLGLSTALFEQESLGGTCLNSGCIPTKILLKSAEVLELVEQADEFGLVRSGTASHRLDIVRVQQRKKRIVGNLVQGVAVLLQKNGVAVFRERASFADSRTVIAGGVRYTADSVIIATGSVPRSLPIPIRGDRVHTSKEILNLSSIPERLAVVGGGVIGLEFAHFFAAAGSQLTVVEGMNRLLPMADREISDAVTADLTHRGVEIVTSAMVKSIDDDVVTFGEDGKDHKLQADAVLVSVGRASNLGGLKHEVLGLEMKDGFIISDDSCRTNVHGIYAIGDVNGRSMLAHSASREGIVAAETISGMDRRVDYAAIPGAVYTNPEIAWVGLSEEEARRRYADVRIGRFPFKANGKAMIENSTSGFVKIVTAEPHNEIVGVHIYGIHATDLIAETALAMGLECTGEELVTTVHPHPTVSEVIHEAAHAVLGHSIHL